MVGSFVRWCVRWCVPSLVRIQPLTAMAGGRLAGVRKAGGQHCAPMAEVALYLVFFTNHVSDWLVAIELFD